MSQKSVGIKVRRSVLNMTIPFLVGRHDLFYIKNDYTGLVTFSKIHSINCLRFVFRFYFKTSSILVHFHAVITCRNLTWRFCTGYVYCLIIELRNYTPAIHDFEENAERSQKWAYSTFLLFIHKRQNPKRI